MYVFQTVDAPSKDNRAYWVTFSERGQVQQVDMYSIRPIDALGIPSAGSRGAEAPNLDLVGLVGKKRFAQADVSSVVVLAVGCSHASVVPHRFDLAVCLYEWIGCETREDEEAKET